VRYAILFSGMTERRNLNGLEFCYRILVEQFGFHSQNVYALTYDGSLRTIDDPLGGAAVQAQWPGDSTEYRLKVVGEGSRQGLGNVLNTLKLKLTKDDLLFINTTGHGGNYGDGRGPFLVTYPRRARYWMGDFCADLTQLPPHRSMVVLMAQCFAGGFNDALLQSTSAVRTYIASASARHSHAMDSDLNWDSFERNWLARIAGRDVNGTTLPEWENAPLRRAVTVSEAFEYAATTSLRSLRDLPVFSARPKEAAAITLADGY
jgi:hypothetical protein